MGGGRRAHMVGLVLVLAAGLVLGWLYGRPLTGLVVAALLALGWQTKQLFALEKAVRTGKDGVLRHGNSLWAQLYSRFSYERRRAQKHKRRHRRLLKEVRKSTNALPDGAVILSKAYDILLCNPAAEELAGFRPRLDRGQRVDNIVRDPAFAAYVRAGNFDGGVEIRSPLRDGDWLFLRIVPYGADQYLLLIRDVTERIRLSRMRREFVANASHELRSPLTVISGYLDALVSDPETPESWQKPVTVMQSQAQRMKAIVAELLELSRLEAAGRVVDDARIDICHLLEAAKRSWEGQAGVPAIDIRCESRSGLSGSPAEIESVVSNLLSNAVRHTPADGRITLSWRAGPDGGLLSVEDTGEGIDEADIPRVTERFFRVNRGRSREGGGVGLGLAIVKHVLQRHDGVLAIESRVGHGSTFTCRFPPERIAAASPVDLHRSGRAR